MSERLLIVNWWEIALVPVAIAAILLLMVIVRWQADRFDLSPENQRKIIHIAVGLASLSFPLIFSSPLPVLLLIAIAIIIMLILRRGHRSVEGLGSVLHSVRRRSHGEIYLALAVALLFLRSEDAPVLYVLPLLVITLSDTASALVGTAYGRFRFAVEDGSKSLEGVVAFFMVTLVCSMVVLLLMSDAARLNIIVLSFLIAAFCSLVEADSWRGLDNLFVPVGAHLLLSRHLDTTPEILLLIAVIFIAAVFLAIRYAEVWGITRHAARAYTILFFLILSVTAPFNAILPIVMIVAHIVARNLKPCRSDSSDLDLLATTTGVGLLWLLAGEMAGSSAINLFNLTFAGVVMVYAALATTSVSRYWRLALIPIAFGVIRICTMVVWTNPVESSWYDPPWPPMILASVALATGVGLCKPDWFSSWRSVKAFGVALIIPAILFLIDGVSV